MKLSDIAKNQDVSSRIVQYRTKRTSRRRADLLESITKDLEELRGLSRGVEAGEGLDTGVALDEAVQAINRLKSVLSSS